MSCQDTGVMRRMGFLASCAYILLASGCASSDSRPDGYDRFQSDDVNQVNMLTRLAVDTTDVRAIPYLVRNLTHEDQWTRLMTHMALLKIVYQATGKHIQFGYYWLDLESEDASRVKRAKSAIQAWEDWWEREGKLLLTTPPDGTGAPNAAGSSG